LLPNLLPQAYGDRNLPRYQEADIKFEGCDGRIVWRVGQPSRWLDERAQMQRGQIQHGWCEACAAHFEQRSTMTETSLWLEVSGRWERAPLREVCVL
jgi:hypothetical protein